jgi:hypothetical protein
LRTQLGARFFRTLKKHVLGEEMQIQQNRFRSSVANSFVRCNETYGSKQPNIILLLDKQHIALKEAFVFIYS